MNHAKPAETAVADPAAPELLATEPETQPVSQHEPMKWCCRPAAIVGLSGLIELRVTDNQLRALPDSISGLVRLRELHLRNNLLTTLPDAVRFMCELRQIDVRGNPLTSLPASLATLPRLEKLDVRWVTTLTEPPWFAELEARGCAIHL
jgi:Leucine-rich repeat (LRR) protein